MPLLQKSHRMGKGKQHTDGDTCAWNSLKQVIMPPIAKPYKH